MNRALISTLLLFVITTIYSRAESAWETKLRHELPLLGHRNWIVIADAAYPLQTAPGIETVYADTDQLQAVKTVLAAVGKARHVKPIVYTDSELNFVVEKDAPGINDYRSRLRRLLQNLPQEVLPHEKIIGKLDAAGKTFKVLIIKTRLTMPYTSVFLELDCGYWNNDSEKRLRETMKAGEEGKR